MTRRLKDSAILLLLFACLAAAVVIAVGTGAVRIPIKEFVDVLLFGMPTLM
jgi:hypothetical protein